MYKYEIWLHNHTKNSVSIFVDGKEYIYELPHENFELCLNCGLVVRYIGHYAGILSSCGNLNVCRDGNTEWIEFESPIPLEWLFIFPTDAENCCGGIVWG